MKKAVVFDNSGTLIERYRVIKDVYKGNFFSNITSLDLIDQGDALALAVLQFNTNRFLQLNPETLISDVITKYNIDFDISFSSRPFLKSDVGDIIDSDKTAKVSDITEGFQMLVEKIPKIDLCNGSALIVDMNSASIAYTITSAGKFFPGVFDCVRVLKSRGIEIFLASGDRNGAINKLANYLDIPHDNAFGSVSPKGKCEIVSSLKHAGYKVMMVGDGLNDLLAFNEADVSVLTVEQQEEVSPKLIGKTDYTVSDIFQVTAIDF